MLCALYSVSIYPSALLYRPKLCVFALGGRAPELACRGDFEGVASHGDD